MAFYFAHWIFTHQKCLFTALLCPHLIPDIPRPMVLFSAYNIIIIIVVVVVVGGRRGGDDGMEYAGQGGRLHVAQENDGTC